MKNSKIFILLIIAISLVIRLWNLGEVPAGHTDDEINYIYNAYSLAQTGQNIFGETFPFLSWTYGGRVFPYLPVPTYFLALFIKIFGFSAFSARLTTVVLGILDIFIIYALVNIIFKEKRLALLSAAFLAISPWHIFLSRIVYDANFSFIFYLLAIFLFVFEIKKKRWPVFSLISFWLAVFSYRGMNPLFPALVLILAWYGFSALQMNKRQFISFVIGALFVTLSLVFVAHREKGYLAEVSIPVTNIQENVDLAIREAKGPLFIRRLFLNKATFMLRKWRENYLDAYSPSFLFLRAEPNVFSPMWSRGKFYTLDLFFILFGFIYFFRKKSKEAYLIFFLLAAAGIPGLIYADSYSSRDFFLAAVLPVITGGGLLYLYSLIPSKRLGYIFFIFIFLCYSYLLGSFLFDYQGRFVVYGSRIWGKGIKDVSLFIMNNKNSFDKIVIAPTRLQEFLHYSYYSKTDLASVQKALKEKGGVLVLGNVYFYSQCERNSNIDPKTAFAKEGKRVLVILFEEECYKSATPSGLIKDFAGNTVWRIYQ